MSNITILLSVNNHTHANKKKKKKEKHLFVDVVKAGEWRPLLEDLINTSRR